MCRMSSVDMRQAMTTTTVGVGTWLFHHIIVPITKPDLGVSDSCDAALTTNRCVTERHPDISDAMLFLFIYFYLRGCRVRS